MMQTVQTVFDFETAARESFVFPRDERKSESLASFLFWFQMKHVII